MARFLFRTRIASDYGSGHLQRAARLARSLLDQGGDRVECLFAVEGCEASAASVLAAWNLKIDAFSRTSFQTDEEQELLARLAPDAVIWDMLDMTSEQAAALAYSPASGSGRKRHLLIQFADITPIRPEADIAVCPQTLPASPQAARPDQIVLYGPRWMAIDARIADLLSGLKSGSGQAAETASRARSCLVCLGGMAYPEPLDLVTRALQLVRGDLSVCLITGAWAAEETQDEEQKQAALRVEIARRLPDAEILETCSDLPDRLARADMAVLAGGLVKYEAAALGVPSLLLALVPHQEPLARSFAESGAALFCGQSEDLAPEDLARAIDLLAGDPGQRRALSEKGRELVDGRGLTRLGALLLEQVGAH